MYTTDATGLTVPLCQEDSYRQDEERDKGWEASCLGLRLCGLAPGLVVLTCINAQML